MIVNSDKTIIFYKFLTGCLKLNTTPANSIPVNANYFWFPLGVCQSMQNSTVSSVIALPDYSEAWSSIPTKKKKIEFDYFLLLISFLFSSKECKLQTETWSSGQILIGFKFHGFKAQENLTVFLNLYNQQKPVFCVSMDRSYCQER